MVTRPEFWTLVVSLVWVIEAAVVAVFCGYFFFLTRLDRRRLRGQGLLGEEQKKSIAIFARSACNRGLWAILTLWAGLQPFFHPETVEPVTLATGLTAIGLQTITLVLTVLDYRARVYLAKGGWKM